MLFGVLFVDGIEKKPIKGLKQKKDLLRAQVKSLSSKVKVSLAQMCEVEGLPKGLWGVFKPLRDEPELVDVPTDVELYWPCVKNLALSEMVFSKAEQFKKSNLGFMEPSSLRETPKNKISVIFVPGQAFDFKGNRLGRGKGFYDRYLSDFDGITVGVCSRERFLSSPIPVDQKFDVAVQYILTEQFLYKVNPYKKKVV